MGTFEIIDTQSTAGRKHSQIKYLAVVTFLMRTCHTKTPQKVYNKHKNEKNFLKNHNSFQINVINAPMKSNSHFSGFLRGQQ